MLRPARPDEFPWIAEMIHMAFADYSARLDMERPPRERSSKDWVQDAIAAGSVLVFEEAQPVGVVILSEEDGAAHIDQIAIDPQAQGRGLGTALLAATEDHVARLGYSAMHLHTAQPMTELVSFYSRAGYRVVKVGPRPKDPDGIDRVYFAKSLRRKP